MSFSPATEAEASARSSPAPATAAREDVEYPEGHWIAQSVAHGVAVRQAATALDLHFRQHPDVLVAMEVMVYYERGNSQARLQPDVQVVYGVGRANRSSYKVWEEGKAPDFVLEVASPSTAETDARHKAREYALIGVGEYWRLDPAGGLMSSPLEGYVVCQGSYAEVEPVAAGGQWLRSAVLGLELRGERQAGATVLVLRDPQTGEEFDGAPAAVEQRRRAAEDRASAEAERRRAAEDRASAAEDRASAEARRARAAEEKVRALEKQLRNRAAHNPPPEGEP
jgi:Uma2 family endonuclease